MRHMTTDQRMQMLYNLLPPARPEHQTVLDGWRQDDITVAMHALRRARVQWRRGRLGEARAWLCVAEEIVRVIFANQDGPDDDDDMDPFTSHVDAFAE